MMKRYATALLLLLIFWVYTSQAGNPIQTEAAHSTASTALATFAGGCFWCMEEAMEKLNGVVSVSSGYTGGHTDRPSYRQVSSGSTGHAEAVQVVYDPERIDYPSLLHTFWRNVDPIARNGQFCDHGSQYRAAIFPHNPEQKKLAEASLIALKNNAPFVGEITTTIEPLAPFFNAETHHQDYYKKNPLRYKTYKYGCGRSQRLKLIWGDEAGGHHG